MASQSRELGDASSYVYQSAPLRETSSKATARLIERLLASIDSERQDLGTLSFL